MRADGLTSRRRRGPPRRCWTGSTGLPRRRWRRSARFQRDCRAGFDDPAVEERLQGFGYVVPRSEKRAVMAMTWLSSKWAGRAPEGKALVRAFVGRAGQQELLERPDDQLVAIVRRELDEVLGIAAEPELVKVFRWDSGMPQYALGHLERVEVIEAAMSRLPGLAVAGNMFRGVGLPDCIASGERAADKVATEVLQAAPLAATHP